MTRPEQIAAAILTRVRELAEIRFGGQIRHAVVTMSACPPDGYRASLVRAARLAHLEIIETVAEPIAGALAVGAHAEVAERKLVICDFGGGTFDVTAIVQAGLRFTPVATFGDPLLGGDDLDEALAEGLAGAVYRKCGFDLHRDVVRWSRLVMRCEGAKRQLSSRTDAPFVMREAYLERARSRDIDVLIDRPWAEALWAPLFERVRATIKALLERAGWRPNDVDQVVLIGGGALVPMFQRTVTTIFAGRDVTVAPPGRPRGRARCGVAHGTPRHGASRRAGARYPGGTLTPGRAGRS